MTNWQNIDALGDKNVHAMKFGTLDVFKKSVVIYYYSKNWHSFLLGTRTRDVVFFFFFFFFFFFNFVWSLLIFFCYFLPDTACKRTTHSRWQPEKSTPSENLIKS